MSNSYGFGGDEIREESTWRYPLGIFFATLVLCAIFLYHYVGPGVDDLQGATPKPTISEEKIRLTIAGTPFYVPANHTIFPKDRRDKNTDALSLYAIWPTMNGYTPPRRLEFVEDRADSRRIDILISERSSVFSEDQRLELLYLPHVIDKQGQAGDYQLTKFVFKEGRANTPTNGYSDKDLLVGEGNDGNLAVLFCYRTDISGTIPAKCYREFELSENISVRYTFKKTYLPDWREIDEQTRSFLIRLADES